MEFEYINIDELKEYEGNAKRHPKKQIRQIMKSIEDYGYNDPIGIDENNMILEGHGRLQALKELGYKEIPVVRLTGMTEEEKKAYILVHNKINMNTGFDDEKLFGELDSLKIDLSDFGFNMDKAFDKAFIDTNAVNTQKQVENILNLGKAQYDGAGKYDIPEIKPVKKLGEIKEWIGFNYVLSDTEPEGKAVHFFIDDYQFERIWNDIDKYVDKLKRYVCVTSPDFSPYGDMPLATQIYNHYRKHWVGRYLQEHGVTVIPTIRASTDPRSKEWYLDGEPKKGIVCISSMWATKDERQRNIFLDEYKTMYDTLKPTKIFVYGKLIDGLEGNIENIKSFGEKRWSKNDN